MSKRIDKLKKFFSDENLDKMMKHLYSLLILLKEKVIKLIVSPPKRIKIHLSDIKKRISRLFRFSITFKITVLSLFKLFRQLIGLTLLLSIGFFGINMYFITTQMNSDIDYLASVATGDEFRDRNLFESFSSSKSQLVHANINGSYIIDTSGHSLAENLSPKNLIDSSFLYLDRYNLALSRDDKNQYYILVSRNISMSGVNSSITLFKDFADLYDLFLIFWISLGVVFLLFMRSNSKYVSNLTKKMMTPVYIMNDAIKEINVANLDKRLNIQGSQDELRDLSTTVNNMFDRIQDSYNKQKQFVSDASHELRTPIAVIQGYANLLNRWGKDDPEVLQESIDAIKDESDNMKDLVEKLLFLARADKDTQKISKETFRLDELVDNICKESKLIDTNHNIVCNSESDISVFADKKLIKQCVRILVDNSMKYTPDDGSITLSTLSDSTYVFVRISDTGIGIPEKDIPYLFDRFYRVDESRSKANDKGGTGLGLSIANWIAKVHNGEILVESILSKGSIFTLKLPITDKSQMD